MHIVIIGNGILRYHCHTHCANTVTMKSLSSLVKQIISFPHRIDVHLHGAYALPGDQTIRRLVLGKNRINLKKPG